jgi:hypothetical protein
MGVAGRRFARVKKKDVIGRPAVCVHRSILKQ